MAIAAGWLFCSAAVAQVTLSGADSTFIEPIMAKWIAEYQKKHSDVIVNYLPIGSGAGIAQTMRGMLDFGA
ncbi:MAG TPA: phosphate ABC transporter substrate-binding protein PstS, partial [Terriglobales bacterium]